jgi:hypothetical protein
MGSDRHGSLYWLIDATVWACNENWLKQFPPHTAASPAAGGAGGGGDNSGGCGWRCYMKGDSIQRLLAFLNPKGPREGALLQRLHRAGFIAPSSLRGEGWGPQPGKW